MHVLIVDDDPVTTQLYELALSAYDTEAWTDHFDRIIHDVEWADIDVVIVDKLLGIFDGTELLKWLRVEHPRVKRIMVTADHSVNVDENPAHLIIFKPADIDDLRDAVTGE